MSYKQFKEKLKNKSTYIIRQYLSGKKTIPLPFEARQKIEKLLPKIIKQSEKEDNKLAEQFINSRLVNLGLYKYQKEHPDIVSVYEWRQILDMWKETYNILNTANRECYKDINKAETPKMLKDYIKKG